jgi:hypothetical protein
MRFRYAVTVIAAVAVAPGDVVRSVLAGAASALFEALPFLVLAMALRRLLPPARSPSRAAVARRARRPAPFRRPPLCGFRSDPAWRSRVFWPDAPSPG